MHTTGLEKLILQYDGEVAYTDYQIGKLINAIQTMDLIDNTLIIITADHGEGLGQHGFLLHTFYVYEEAVRVPLLFFWPGHIIEGQVFDTPVSHVDIMPTILDLVGIEEDDSSFHGQSLAASLRGKSKLAKNRAIYLHRRYFAESYAPTPFGEPIYVNGDKFGIRTGNWKYIESKKEDLLELFDLENDPNELRNLYDAYPKKAIELASKLKKWRQSYTKIEAVERDVSEDDLLKLKALGYTD
jgi:arylsulfatase A-like enzyme